MYITSIVLAILVAIAAPTTPLAANPKLPNISTQFKNAFAITPTRLAYMGAFAIPIHLSTVEYAIDIDVIKNVIDITFI